MADKLNGQEIQGYKISKQIGEGKFSTVYKAVTENNEIYALKKIKVTLIDTDFRHDGPQTTRKMSQGSQAHAAVGASQHNQTNRIVYS